MTLDPFDNPLLWDKLVLVGGAGKFTTPGICKISANIGLNEDSADVPGQDGLQKTLLGYKSATFDAVIQVWTAAQFKELIKIIQLFQPKNKQAPKAVIAIHPQIQMLNAKEIYITDVTIPPYSSKDGYIVNFKLEQWTSKTSGKRTVEERSSSNSSTVPNVGAATATPSGNDWAKPPVKPSTITPKPKP